MTDPKDLKLLWMFTLRIGMYTGVENKDTISSFLHGYEAGRDGDCNFIEHLSNSIAEEYKIENKATGWIGQIHLTAEKLNSNWATVFKQQSFKVLNKELIGSNLKEFHESFRKRIHGKASGLKYHFRKVWINDWLGIVDVNAEWFRKIWTDRELQLIEQIDTELKTGDYKNLNDQITPSEKMKGLCEQLNEEMDLKGDES